MTAPRSLPFEYPFQWDNESLREGAGVTPEGAAILGQRDRDLEDYLSALAVVSGAGKLLGYTQYRPASEVLPSPAGGTFKDVDSTNLSVTFTVPDSGAVLVSLTSRVYSVNASLYWNLRTTAGANVAGSDADVAYSPNNIQPRVTHRFRLTGLTPGVSTTYRWGFAGTANDTGMRYGGATGPAVMEVWAA